MICNLYFQLKKGGSPKKLCYCARPELIENYDLAIADKERTWYCHHKKEEFYTQQELKDSGLYYNVPPEDLVFVRDQEEHYSWPHKGHDLQKGKQRSEETKRKISEKAKGRKHSEEIRRKMSKNQPNKIKVQCVETGQVFDSIKAAKEFVRLKDACAIREALKNPKRTSAGYHWSKL